MKISFIIITYGNTNVNNCIKSIRNYYKDIRICIIDNNLSSNTMMFNDNNIYYYKNNGNFFELGAIWFATKNITDIDKFIIFHNSFILNKELPNRIFEESYVPFWTANVCDYSPVIPWVEQKLNEINIKIQYNKTWNSVCGCCCSINRNILQSLIENRYGELYATSKFEAVGCEILFGYLIHNILKIESTPLHKYPIYTYAHKKEPWVWISKVLQGQGQSNPQKLINMPVSMFDRITFTNIHSRNDIFIDTIKFVNEDKNINLQEILRKTGNTSIRCENKSINSVLPSVRHRMFTKKYFLDYFNDEFKKICNKEKIIC